jgi:hypothetical protein
MIDPEISGTITGGALGDNPARLLAAPGSHRALYGAQAPVAEPIRIGQLEPPQNFQCRYCRVAIEPGADLILYLLEHRRPFRNRLAAAVRAAMRRPPFTVPPRRPEAGGKAVEIDNERLRRHRLYPPAIDPFPELGLSRADLREQHDGIGSGAETSGRAEERAQFDAGFCFRSRIQ